MLHHVPLIVEDKTACGSAEAAVASAWEVVLRQSRDDLPAAGSTAGGRLLGTTVAAPTLCAAATQRVSRHPVSVYSPGRNPAGSLPGGRRRRLAASPPSSPLIGDDDTVSR